MYSVTRKLKALKPVFRQQRRKKGDLANNVKLAAGFLEVAQKLLQADRHNSLLLQLENCCSYQEANKRLFQISDSDGLVQTDPNTISSVFVTYFQDLLGGDRTNRALDLHYLRPWARHILTEEEACALIRPVTVEEVKTAMFDIEEDKAPGPDGFSSGFYKAAWPILGKLMTQWNGTFFLLLFVYLAFLLSLTGTQQGDPISPYLFVLVMEVLQMILQQFIDQDGQFLYHWRCTELKLFQLSFADDLLLLYKTDMRSEGHLPVRYLGLPLISARLSIADCQPLLQKIDSRIKGWEGVQLSFAGTSSSGYPKVAWEVVCRPIEEGGQGIKDIFALNRALMSKHLWAVIKQDRTSIWVDWISQVRLRDCSIWTVKDNKGAWVGGKCSHLDIHCYLISIFKLGMVILSYFGMIRGTTGTSHHSIPQRTSDNQYRTS
ncbi:hypothetical protein Sango_2979500 [Sesamum angolense]|uniref:Reverse transcriptase domain-containing protein n=1 Tax=Sesamum angolense TaxID=2727404 RepID=A0AAE1T4C1_9LAMI|nr:hypothetical protein Sango_2979500 [Sesamum angolense]